MLNYFTTLGSRGAQTEDERVDQLAKITAGALALNADAIAIIEVRTLNWLVSYRRGWLRNHGMCPEYIILFFAASYHGDYLVPPRPEPMNVDPHNLDDDEGHSVGA